MRSSPRRRPEKLARHPPKSLASAIAAAPGANLAVISVAGRYAAGEARTALENGLHVLLFSDNVPLEDEIALKKLAADRGLLCMGPDVGTAIINGVALGFANAVPRGSVGLVSAAGTGLQGVTCGLARAGAGVSQAIGTGGRDLSEAVGGMTMLAGLAALQKDPRHRCDRADLQTAGCREWRRMCWLRSSDQRSPPSSASSAPIRGPSRPRARSRRPT